MKKAQTHKIIRLLKKARKIYATRRKGHLHSLCMLLSSKFPKWRKEHPTLQNVIWQEAGTCYYKKIVPPDKEMYPHYNFTEEKIQEHLHARLELIGILLHRFTLIC